MLRAGIDVTGTQIDFYDGETKIASGVPVNGDSTLQDSQWISPPPGDHLISARIQFPNGAYYTGAVKITVGGTPPPSGTVATPSITPPGATFPTSTTVTLQCATAGSYIYYTLDGNDPTLASPLYPVPFTLGNSATLKARAYASGLSPSAIASAVFTRSGGTDPVIDMPDLTAIPGYSGLNDSLSVAYHGSYTNVNFI